MDARSFAAIFINSIIDKYANLEVKFSDDISKLAELHTVLKTGRNRLLRTDSLTSLEDLFI